MDAQSAMLHSRMRCGRRSESCLGMRSNGPALQITRSDADLLLFATCREMSRVGVKHSRSSLSEDTYAGRPNASPLPPVCSTIQSRVERPMRLPQPPWISDIGPDSSIVVSSRCRIARNVEGIPFPWRASSDQRKLALDAVLEAVSRAERAFAPVGVVSPDEMDPDSLASLFEWRYATLDWLRGGTHRKLVVLRDGSASMLINEEDHVRAQSLLPGLQVESAYRGAQSVVDLLGRRLRFASSPDIGYLTASLANAGAGLRVSTLLHLPGLAASGRLAPALEAAYSLGCSVRGAFGEGSDGIGDFYQISNGHSFLESEARIIDRVRATASYLVEAEQGARLDLFSSNSGREKLILSGADYLGELFEVNVPPRRLFQIVSTLRLSVCEGTLPATLPETAEWISMLGAAFAGENQTDRVEVHFQAVRRSAALRRKLRAMYQAIGTLRN